MEYKYIGYKIRLYPTQDQIKIFNEYFGLARFVYNLALEIRDNQYQSYMRGETDVKYLSYISINNEIRRLRKTDPKYKWMCKYSSDTICTCIKDLLNGYMKFARGEVVNKPKFKSKKDLGSHSFPVRPDRMVITDNQVRISSIGWVNCKYIDQKIYGSGDKNVKNLNYINFVNPRVSYDGCYYWISFEIKTYLNDKIISYNSNYNYLYNQEYQLKEYNKAIGIDLGCKKDNWIVMSDGYRQPLPDFHLEKRKIAKLFRKASRQRRINKEKSERTNPINNQYMNPSNNEYKTNKKINKYYKKMVNKRLDSIFKAAKHILELKPEAVIMENLKSSGIINDFRMMNYGKRKANEMIYDSVFHLIQIKFSYILSSNNIPLYLAPSDFPSTQLCSNCGNIQRVGKKRIYRCPNCGLIINRDDNAAINLSNWYYSQR